MYYAHFVIRNSTAADPDKRHLSPKEWLAFHRAIREKLTEYGTWSLWMNPPNLLIQGVVIGIHFDEFVTEDEFTTICEELKPLLKESGLGTITVVHGEFQAITATD